MITAGIRFGLGEPEAGSLAVVMVAAGAARVVVVMAACVVLVVVLFVEEPPQPTAFVAMANIARAGTARRRVLRWRNRRRRRDTGAILEPLVHSVARQSAGAAGKQEISFPVVDDGGVEVAVMGCLLTSGHTLQVTILLRYTPTGGTTAKRTKHKTVRPIH